MAMVEDMSGSLKDAPGRGWAGSEHESMDRKSESIMISA
jgi:hypothetical protein